MTETIEIDLGYDTAGHILASVAESGIGFAAANLSAELIWCVDERPDLQVLRTIGELVCGDGPIGRRGAAVGDRGQVVAYPVEDAQGDPRSWMVAWVEDVSEGDSSSHAWKRVEETLPRVTQMLSNECQLATELSGAVRELSNRYEELNIVYRMEQASRDAIPNEALIQELLQGFLRHLNIDTGVIISKSGAHSITARGSERGIANHDLVVTELRGRIWRFVSASREVLILNEPDDDRRPYLAPNMPFKILAIPNSSCGDADSGLILIRHLEDPDFMNSDLSLARVFYGQASMLLENRALLDETQDFTRQIASALVEAVEAKDPYTAGHSERVEQITGGLGEAAGLSQTNLTDLLWGALLHDIGKIGVPDVILMKPGRLTEDEFIFIKTHPTRSYEILRHVTQLGQSALDAARYHQERFDGKGYPFGLSGEEIPVPARIVAIADTYDAITSSRSYRPAASHEKAVSVIESIAGTQLDPNLVQVFLERIQKDAKWLEAIRPSQGESSSG